MKIDRALTSVCGLVIFTLLTFNVHATQKVYWPENGHYYEAISAAGGITWDEAKNLAESLSYLDRTGHLATITSQAENDFIVNNLGGTTVLNNYWIGGFQPDGSPEPDGNWQWVTDEPWSYTNWYGGGPNNCYGGDEGVHPYGWPEDAVHLSYDVGEWNDFPHDIPRPGYIVEYPTKDSVLTLSNLGLIVLLALLILSGIYVIYQQRKGAARA